MATEAFREAAEIIKYRELLRNLVVRDIKVRYKRSFLGFVWVMLNPLLMMLILNMVFSEVFRISTKNYAAYLLSGIILWNFFSQSTSTAVVSLTGNSNLIKKIYIPKAIFPLSVVLSALINFGFSLIPLFVIFLLTGTEVSSHVYLLPLIFVLLGLFAYGVALAISTLTVFFHDTIYIYEVLLLAWMYLTPIFYPESIIPERFAGLFQLNPFYHFIKIFRGALYMDVPTLAQNLLYGFLFAIVFAAAGWLLYNRHRDRVVYYL